jgi:hypothetical protein
MSDHQLWMVTDMAASLLEKINIRKFTTVNNALREAISLKGKTARIIINRDAGLLVPVSK